MARKRLLCKMACCLGCLMLALAITLAADRSNGDECHITPVIHVLQHHGCVPKPIPSFACQGRCTSYVQVSGYKLWQTERSCMCCQEMGVREASVSLYCPKSKLGEPRFRKVITRAPVDCLCRPCTALDDHLMLVGIEGGGGVNSIEAIDSGDGILDPENEGLAAIVGELQAYEEASSRF